MGFVKKELEGRKVPLYKETVQWIKQFERDNGRRPRYEERENQQTKADPLHLAAQLEAEAKMREDLGMQLDSFLIDFFGAPYLSRASDEMMLEDVSQGVQGNSNHFDHIGFENAFDSAYHILVGDDNGHEFDEDMNDILTQAIEEGQYWINEETGDLHIVYRGHVLIVYVKGGRAYAKAFFKMNQSKAE